MSKNLFQLISSLSAREKAYLKKYLSANKKNSKKSELFDYLNSLKIYDRELAQRFSKKKKINYNPTSTGLYNTLQQYLRIYYKDKNDIHYTYNKLLDALILTDHSLLNQASSTYKHLASFAKEKPNNLLKLYVNTSHLDFLRVHGLEQDRTKLNSIYDNQIDILKNELTLSLYDNIFVLCRPYWYFGFNKLMTYKNDTEEIESKLKLLKSSLHNDENEYYYLHALTAYYGITCNSKMVIETLDEYIKSMPQGDIEYYNGNLMHAMVSIVKHKLITKISYTEFDLDLERLNSQLSKVSEKRYNFKIAFESALMQIKILSYSLKEQYETGCLFIKNEVDEILEESNDSIAKARLAIVIMHFYVRFNKLDIAIGYNNHLEYIKNDSVKFRVLLMETLSAFEEDIESLFSSRITSLRRLVKPLNFDILNDLLSDLRSAFNNRDCRNQFFEKYASIKEEDNNFLKVAFCHFNFSEWAKLKLYKCNFHNLETKIAIS